MHINADRVLETSTSTGTGAFSLDGAVAGFRTFASVMSVADTCSYTIEAVNSVGLPTGAWEAGTGTYSGANTLTRTTPLASSNAGAAVAFAAGTKRVSIQMNAAAFDAKAALASPAFTGTPTAPTAAPGTATTQLANTAFVAAAFAALVASSPAALDTLNELAAALGNDANYATTVTNALALKAPLASPTFTGVVSIANGAVGAPALTFASDPDTGLYRVAADNLALVVNGARALDVSTTGVQIFGNTTLGDASGDSVTINAAKVNIPNGVNLSSGNVGIATTPAAWSANYRAVQIARASFWGGTGGSEAFMSVNTYFDGTNYRAIAAGTGATISMALDAITFNRMTSVAAGAVQTLTENARFDLDGNLLVGTTALLAIAGLNANHSFAIPTSNRWTGGFQSSAASPFGLAVKYTGAVPNVAGNGFLYCEDQTTLRAYLYSNGGLANYSANNVNLSDEREKFKIRALNPAKLLDAYLAIPLFDYWYKDQTHEDDNLGTVAQRLYDSHPYNRRFVDTDSWTKPDGETRMSVYDGDLHYFTMAMTQHAHFRLNDNEVQRDRLIAALETYHPDIRERLAA